MNDETKPIAARMRRIRAMKPPSESRQLRMLLDEQERRSREDERRALALVKAGRRVRAPTPRVGG